MLDFETLTEKQHKIYLFIREQIESRGYGPTVREIGDAFGIKSPNGVMCHLKALQAKNFIERDPRHARAIKLVGHKRPFQGLPLLGSVAAGAPIEAIETDDHLDLPELFGEEGVYALRVRGESMIEDHIEDGDYVVIKRKETADRGERVVAMVNNDVTLKRFYQEGDRIRLEPANGEMESIYVDSSEDAHILGVLVGVVRKC